MTEEGKYIYCIIGKAKEKSFGCIGINNREINIVHYKPSTRAKRLVPHRNEVSGAGDISAVISSTPIINFDRLNKRELIKYLAVHQQVNEEMMKDYDVVPMTFGIIAPSVDEVLRILKRAYFQFKTALKNIAGKAEFAVQVWWNPQKILEELANTNPEIQKLKKEVSLKGSPEGKPPHTIASNELRGRSVSYGVNILGMSINPVRGQRGVVERQREQTSNGVKLKLGKLIQKEAEIQRQSFINDIHTSLKNLSFDSTLNKLIDKEMIANFSFLIEKDKESELDKKMQGLGKKYEGKLRFKYIGPMPPYSFVNINLSLGNFELINEARKLLGLAEEVSFDEIKKVYYALSCQYHPDKFQGDEAKMKKITQNYRLLENYCQSCDEISRKKENSKYSFTEENVKKAVLVR